MTALTPCWCCGEERAESELVRLGCHDEVALCDGCVGWLGDQRAQRGAVGVRRAIPILLTTDLRCALEHYEALGFATEAWEGGGYGFLNCGDVELHLGEVDARDPATNTVSCYLHVRDADALYAEWAAAGVGGQLTAPIDTDYGLREGGHVDPDGNLIRFGSPIPHPEPPPDAHP
jgi:predicted enzyme related to lactoylglutathione lyase